ncbi:MAG: hypothetical protein ACI9XJ_002331 [Marivirga sp.]|jgi:hypothetical protein
MIHYTSSTIEVYFYHERIALHVRNKSMGIYNTNKSHLSSTHNDYTNWSPEYFKNKAAKHGENVVACIKGLFIDCDIIPRQLIKGPWVLFNFIANMGLEDLTMLVSAPYMQMPSPILALKTYYKRTLTKNHLRISCYMTPNLIYQSTRTYVGQNPTDNIQATI